VLPACAATETGASWQAAAGGLRVSITSWLGRMAAPITSATCAVSAPRTTRKSLEAGLGRCEVGDATNNKAAAGGQDQLDVTQAEAEAVIQPDSVLDHLGRKPR
jgi:hypothetical protein